MRFVVLLIVVLAGFAGASAAQAGVPCSEVMLINDRVTNGTWDDTCELRDSFDLGVGGERRHFKVYDASRFAYSGRDWHVRLSHEALERAAPYYGRFARVPSITVVFAAGTPRVADGRDRGRRILGETLATMANVHACTIVLSENDFTSGYPSDETRKSLLITVAHEAFHCAQYKTWPRKTIGEMYTSGAEWWMEGTAEYFSHSVFTEIPLPASRASMFDEGIGRLGLMGLGHANGVFFSFYGETAGGPAGVIRFIERMAEAPGQEVQMSAAAAVADIGETLQAFAHRYFDRRLSDPGGHPIPVNPSEGTAERIADAGDKTIRVKPWTIRAVRYAFRHGTNWKIEQLSAEGSAQVQMRHSDDRDEWRRAPFDVLSCARERTVILTPTAAEARAGDREIRLRIEDEIGDERTCPCPLGAWTVSTEDVNANYAVPASGADASVKNRVWKTRLASGTPQLEIRRDGTMSYHHHLTFESERQPIEVPGFCTSDVCWRACIAGLNARASCAPKRVSYQQLRVIDELQVDWTWRRREDTMIRTITASTGVRTIYLYDGFDWKFVKRTPSKASQASTSGNPFRCVGAELHIDPTPASGVAGSNDDLIAMLERGNAQQREAAARLRALQDRTRDDAAAKEAQDRMAQGAGRSVKVYPFTGRFVR